MKKTLTKPRGRRTRPGGAGGPGGPESKQGFVDLTSTSWVINKCHFDQNHHNYVVFCAYTEIVFLLMT